MHLVVSYNWELWNFIWGCKIVLNSITCIERSPQWKYCKLCIENVLVLTLLCHCTLSGCCAFSLGTCALRRPAPPAPASTRRHRPRSHPGTGRAPGCSRAVPPPGWSETTRSSTGTPGSRTCWWRRGWWHVPADHLARRRTPHPECGRWTRSRGLQAPARPPWRFYRISTWPFCPDSPKPLHLQSFSLSLWFAPHELSKQQGTTTCWILNPTKPCSAGECRSCQRKLPSSNIPVAELMRK